jgi:heterodisulfide reductase subunit B
LADTSENKSDLGLKYSFFLGCVIPNRYPLIEQSTRTLMKEMKIKLLEMEGASCCPAPGVFRSVDPLVWLTLGARNINIAQQQNTDIMTMCNGCYGTLLEVNHKMKHDPKVNAEVNKVLAETGRNFDGSVKVKHLMEVLYMDIGIQKLKSMVKNKLGLKVAVHYGCHILKPSFIRPFGGTSKDPTFFDEIVEAMGCESVDYRDKLLCCGAGGGVRTGLKETSLQFTHQKLKQVRKSGADLIVVCCPFCHLQYDLGQVEVNKMIEGEEPFHIPILYIAQLIGLALGLDPQDLGLVKPTDIKGVTPFISLDSLLEKIPKIQEKSSTGGNKDGK